MALYTRIWAGSQPRRQTTVRQQLSPLTLQAALEVIQASRTPTHTEIRLAYSLWEKEVLSKRAPSGSPAGRRRAQA
jgi:hypothetical protein